MAEEKLKLGFYWAASCGGCEIAVLDLNEKILDVVQIADIVFWPVAMDVKYKDVEAMPDKYIDICFFNGSVRNEEQEHMAKLLRQKSKTLVAFGSCAQEGCIPGLANLHDRKEIFKKVYLETKSTINPSRVLPKTKTEVKEGLLKLPEFYDTVKTLDQTVEVDYYLPGCPPPVKLIANAVEAIAKNALPPKGLARLRPPLRRLFPPGTCPGFMTGPSRTGWYVVEHLMFFGVAVLYWWPLYSPSREFPPISYPGQMIYLVLVAIGMTPVFAFVTFSNRILGRRNATDLSPASARWTISCLPGDLTPGTARFADQN